jgi:hypothetical protein
MGNTPVTVGLHTDQSCYTAGDLVTGKIYISVTKPQPATVLNIRILGEENTVIHHTTTETSNRHHSTSTTREEDHYEQASSAFFNLDYPIHMFPKQIQVGQYEFPFTITLPSNLPSSIICRKRQSYAQVHYQITAKLQTTTGLFQQAPQKTQVLQIMAAPPLGSANDSALQLPTERVPVTKCCCRKKGHVALAASFDKTVVRPNETIGVAFTANNQSTVRVDTVRVILEEYVEWRAHGRTEKVHRVLQKVDLPASDYPELAKLQRNPNTYFGGGSTSTGTSTMDQQHPFIHNNNNTPARSIQGVRIPTDATDSYHGRWIEVRHALSVRLLTPGCCATNPEACARLQIRRTTAPPTPPTPSAPPSEYDLDVDTNIPAPASAPIIVEAEAVLPAGWSAQTAEVVDIPMVQATLLLDNKHPNSYDNFV